MKFPEEVAINEGSIEKVIAIYKKAYKEILGELEHATNFGIKNRLQILKQIEVILKDLGVDTAKIIRDEITRAYELGATESVEQLRYVGAEIKVARGFNRIHADAVEALVDDTQKSFLESLQGVKRSASQLLGKAVRQQITERLAVGTIGGKTLKDVQKSIIQTFREEGLTALTSTYTNKNGTVVNRQWSLEQYSEMLIRTKAVEARNRGLINRMAENGYDLVQVSAHAGCDLCRPWEGKILSVTGQTKGFPTVEQAEKSGLFHPNCRHAINTLIPELAKVTNAYNPNVDTLTGKDFVDEVDEKYKKYYRPPNQIIATKTPSR